MFLNKTRILGLARPVATGGRGGAQPPPPPGKIWAPLGCAVPFPVTIGIEVYPPPPPLEFCQPPLLTIPGYGAGPSLGHWFSIEEHCLSVEEQCFWPRNSVSHSACNRRHWWARATAWPWLRYRAHNDMERLIGEWNNVAIDAHKLLIDLVMTNRMLLTDKSQTLQWWMKGGSAISSWRILFRLYRGAKNITIKAHNMIRWTYLENVHRDVPDLLLENPVV